VPATIIAVWAAAYAVHRLIQYGVLPVTPVIVPTWFPYLGGIAVRRNVGRIAEVLGRLLGAGAPLPAALETAAALNVRARYRRALERIKAATERGESIEDALGKEGRRFPESFRTVAALGGRSGLLAEAFEHIAYQYRQEAAKRTRILIDALVPAGVAVLATVTLAAWWALFGTYVALADLLQNSI